MDSNIDISKVLRYPGGKSKLAPFMEDVLVKNGYLGCIFFEPFAGGAGLGLNLLKRGVIKKLVLNDLFDPIYHFWKNAIGNSEEFIRKIEDTPVTIEEWKKQKEILKNYNEYSSLEQGFAFFFLNRTCFSGIVKGGPIGGIEQKGNYKLDCRFNKERLIATIRELATFKDDIDILNEDAFEIITTSWCGNEAPVFFYIDPPYVKKAKDLYVKSFGFAEHSRLSGILASSKYPWVLSYDDEDDIRKLYGKEGIFQIKYHLNYSIRNKKSRPELIFSNFVIDKSADGH